MSVRDMARFGFLYLNGGIWDDKQIIPAKWINDSVAMNDNKYGYLWWLNDKKNIFSYSAMGDGGNVICCIPQKDLVIAIASKIIRNPRDRWPLFENYIIPAVMDHI